MADNAGERADAAFSGGCWLLSIVTRNYSWVDRFWSIAPPLYVAGFAAALRLFVVFSALAMIRSSLVPG